MGYTNELALMLNLGGSAAHLRGNTATLLSAATETAVSNNKMEVLSWNLLLLMAGIGTLCYVFTRSAKSRQDTGYQPETE